MAEYEAQSGFVALAWRRNGWADEHQIRRAVAVRTDSQCMTKLVGDQRVVSRGRRYASPVDANDRRRLSAARRDSGSRWATAPAGMSVVGPGQKYV